MKICGISDMHGQYDFKIEPCDAVMICGDIIPLTIQRNAEGSEKWLKKHFIPWCNNLPCEKVIFVAGNHDFYLEWHPYRAKEMFEDQDKIVYLDCEAYEYNGKIIYGTPWCKPFYNWAFMETTEKSDERYKDVEHIDILLCHDAPYGTSDILLQKDCPWADGSHIGNQAITNLIERTKPSLVLHGHLHSTNREAEYIGETKVHNVSLLNEQYKMVYEPLYFEID